MKITRKINGCFKIIGPTNQELCFAYWGKRNSLDTIGCNQDEKERMYGLYCFKADSNLSLWENIADMVERVTGVYYG